MRDGPVRAHVVGVSDPSPIESEILRQTEARGADKSICPSEVARALHPEWRTLLTAVRAAAIRLAGEGRIDILRHGRAIDPAETRGVIRLRMRPAGEPGS